MSWSLIRKNNFIVKTYKTRERFDTGAYGQTVTRAQRIDVYMTVCRI